MKMKTLISVLGMLLSLLKASGQENIGQKIEGRVISATGNEPLPGASLLLKKANKLLPIDANGNFSFLIYNPDTLIIRHVGYKEQLIPINGVTTNLLVKLENSSDLDEVVVSTGYQQIPKEWATGSFVFIDSALFNKRVGADVISRLEGNVSGLLFNRNVSSTLSNTGGYNLSIRGRSTLFANDQPLVVVDGFPYDGDISNINPNDIASVTVLKDAAASSIWGVKSGNGVIVLTTKKGKQNQKVNIEVNANTTIGNKPDLFYSPNWINSTDFIDIEKTLFDQGYYDNDLTSSYYPVVSPVVSLLDRAKRGLITETDANNQIDALRNNDFRKEVTKYLYRHSVAQQYNASFRGGGAQNDYFLSMGFDNNLSNQVGNKNYRVTLNANNNFYLFKGFTLSIGYNYIQTKATSNSPLGSMYPSASKPYYYPYAQLVDGNGQSVNLVKNYADSYTDTAGNGQLLNWKYNPLDELKYADNTSTSIDNRFNLGLKYAFLNGFSAELKYQYERLNSTGSNYYSDSTYYARNLINQYTDFTAFNALGLVNPVPIGGILGQSNSLLNSHHLRGQLNYAQTFNGKHDIAIITGSEINQNITESNSNLTYGYDKNMGSWSTVDYSQYYLTNPGGGLSNIPNGTGFGKYTYRYVSYFGNAAYTYNSRYVLSVSGRIDKSNLFGVKTNQKAVPLYSLGAAWLLSKEPFYRLDWVPYLKIRATVGYNANVNTNITAVPTSLYVGNSSYYNLLPYSIIKNPGNPGLRWEKIKMINLAVDFATKNAFLSGSLELYFKKGIDLIGQAPLAPSTGLSTVYGNYSNTKGNGIDISLNTKNINTHMFKWTSSFLFSHAIDKVTKYDIIANASDYIISGDGSGGSIYPLLSKPIFSIYSYKWAGLNDNGDPQGYFNGVKSTNYGNIIANTTVDSMEFNGSARPLLWGSLRNTFSFNRLSLSFNILYKLNYYFRRSSISYYGLYNSWSANKDYYNRWQKPGDEQITNVPSIQYPPVNSDRETFYQYSSVLIDKGDHIRLKDITVSYDCPIHGNKTLTGLQFYFYADNLGVIWRANKDKLDPDLYSNLLPSPKSYSFGIKANF